MSPRALISGVTLDVDGTLYSIPDMIHRGLRQLWPVRTVFRDLHRVRDGMRGQGPFPNFRDEQARRLATQRHIPVAAAKHLVEEVVDHRWMQVFERVRPFRGVHACLASLRDRGLRLGLISEYPIAGKLGGLGLGDFPFQSLVSCEGVGALKPHPAAFLRAAQELGLAPARILHVGDREDSDIQGARASGMRCALLCAGKPGLSTAADFTFSDWSHFLLQLESHFDVSGR